MIEPSNNLSPAGQRRREEILDLAVREATNRRYGRIERRLGAALLLVFVAGGTLIYRNAKTFDRLHSPEIARNGTPASDPKTSGLKPAAEERIEVVQTDPTIVERLSIKAAPPRWKTIGDDELLATLSQSGRPAGLIEINGRTILAFR